jgi:hypothetical protein
MLRGIMYRATRLLAVALLTSSVAAVVAAQDQRQATTEPKDTPSTSQADNPSTVPTGGSATNPSTRPTTRIYTPAPIDPK